MHRALTLIALIVFLLPTLSTTTLAQESTPAGEAAVSLETLMPPVDLFAGSWSVLGRYTPRLMELEEGADFTSAYGVYFGGDDGRRIQIVLAQSKPDRGSLNRAWETTSEWVSQLTYDAEVEVASSRMSDLEEQPLPKGVEDAKRIDGTDDFAGMPFCAGIYAIARDLIAFVRVQGKVELHESIAGGANICDDLATVIARTAAAS